MRTWNPTRAVELNDINLAALVFETWTEMGLDQVSRCVSYLSR